MFDLIRDLMALAKEEGEKAEAAGDARLAKERCGLIVQNEKGNKPMIVECTNTAVDPTENFRIDPEDLAKLEEQYTIISVWHTHPNGDASPSQADLVMLEAYGLPWHIVSWPQGGHSYTEPTGYEAPYTGRVFVHGLLDCYTMIRDWYKRERGVTLKNFERNDKWWERGENLYVDNFASQGFYEIPQDSGDYQVGDVILMQVQADVPNHGAVYVGDGFILHHPYGRLSSRDVFGGYWFKHRAKHLRYGGPDVSAT